MLKSSIIIKLSLLIILLAASISVKADPESPPGPSPFEKVRQLAQSERWYHLLHYHTDLFGQVKSEIPSSSFFLSPDGQSNPLSELLATREAFLNGRSLKVGKLKQSPRCAFPERYEFLKEELQLEVKEVPCPELEQYLKIFKAPKSVTLVFSDAYPDSPASMFGHTFLRINSAEVPLDPLLDLGISYAAAVGPDDNPFVFYWRGMTGGYPGVFSIVPYYVKVDEYTHSEARDLWEYELDFNAAETLSLIRHLWEVQTNAELKYYFFDENCSYLLLSLLEVAKPSWKLTNTHSWVIPADTIRRVARISGAVKSVHFRPSNRKKLIARLDKLTHKQRNQVEQLKQKEIPLSEVKDIQVMNALDSMLAYDKDKDLLSQALIRRSQLGKAPLPDPEPTSTSQPDLGHGSSRLSAAYGVTDLGHRNFAYEELRLRSGYHDLMGDDLGFLKFSEVEFLSFSLRYYSTAQKLTVDRLGIVDIASLSPWVSFEHKISWGVNLDYYSPKDFGCLDCHAARFQLKAGLSLSPLGADSIFYLLGLTDLEAGTSLSQNFSGLLRLGPGVETAFLVHPFAGYKLRAGYSIISDLFQDSRAAFFYLITAEQSYSLRKDWDLRSTFSAGRAWDEGQLMLSYYF